MAHKPKPATRKRRPGKADESALSIGCAVIQRVSERLSDGIPVEMACAMEENPSLSVEQWTAALRDPRVERLHLRATGQRLHWHVTNVLADSRRALDFLERVRPDLYGKPEPQTRVDLTVNNLDASQLSDEQLTRIIAEDNVAQKQLGRASRN